MKFRREKEYVEERLRKAGLAKIPLYGGVDLPKVKTGWSEVAVAKLRLAMTGREQAVQRNVKARDVYKNLFLNGIDSWRFLAGKNVPFEFENLELAQSAVKGDNAVVFVSIHLGAFEMLHRCLPLLRSSKEINLVTSAFRRKNLDRYLSDLRATEHIKVVKDIDLPQILKKIIRNGEILAVMADQSKFGGENFQLLGQQIPLFLKTPITANKLGAALVFFRTFKKNGKHIIRFEKFFEPRGISNIITEQQEIASLFESWILENPEQWAWNYKK